MHTTIEDVYVDQAVVLARIHKKYCKFLHLRLPITYRRNELASHDGKNRLAEIKVPTRIIVGDGDYNFLLELYHETVKGIHKVTVVLYEDKGHMIIGTKVDEEVNAFLHDMKA